MGGYGGMGVPRPTRKFDEYYRCYPTVMYPGPERDHVNYGGKVLLPASALETCSRLHLSWPLMFELINGAQDRSSHAGVVEFTAEEGRIYVPFWVSAKKCISATVLTHRVADERS